MTTKTTKPTTRPSKPAKNEKERKPQFSYEFLDMLVDTTYAAIRKYLEQTKAPQELQEILSDFYCLQIEQAYIAAGGGTDAGITYDYVARASEFISKMGVRFVSPTGEVTPLKEWKAIIAKKKA